MGDRDPDTPGRHPAAQVHPRAGPQARPQVPHLLTYPEAVSWLDGLTNYERQTGFRYDTKNFSLERMRALLAALDDPQRHYPAAVVAGTKGKGSTAAMLTAILTASGHRVGLYTSPHLIEYPERIRIGLEPIGHAEFAELATAVAPAAERLEARGTDWIPTTFEAVTAMALLGFARRGVAAAVLEIGMGGRLDAVNVVHAAVVAITSIGMDHMDQLGGTIPQIAGEKAGVITSPAPVVTTLRTGPGALPVIEAACRAAGAPLTVTTPLEGMEVGLKGAHQLDNAAIAVEAARRMPLKVGEHAIRVGLRDVWWPGRLQVVAHAPEVIVDGAHTVESADALVAAIRDLWKPRRLRLIFGMLRSKDHAGVARRLAPAAERVWCPVLRHPRALEPAELVAHVEAAGGRGTAVADVAAAIAAAREDFAEPGCCVLAAGSLALAGEVMVSLSAP